MKPKDKEHLERDYMKLKKMRRDLVFMTIAPLKGEDHYEILKDAIFPIERAIRIMHELIEEGKCLVLRTPRRIYVQNSTHSRHTYSEFKISR